METTSSLEMMLELDQGSRDGGKSLRIICIQPVGLCKELDVEYKRRKSR